MRTIRVLLAEDNEGDVYLVDEALRRAGLDYVLDVFAHGDDAMRHIGAMERPGSGSLRPDIVILDLNLPGRSGQEILRDFRLRYREIPVIVFTSSGVKADMDGALAAGASRYFRKPSDLDEFLEIGAMVRELANFSGKSRSVGQ